jgi:hypothetical protein
MTQHFFKACRDTLMTLLEDNRYLGATPGILMALHTWGRQLTMHPHMHCLVTSGGYTALGDWHSSKNNFLLPIHVVKALFRGKMQAYIKKAYDNNLLRLPPNWDSKHFCVMHSALFKKPWSIRIQEQYAHGRGVMLYLARYLKGGPLNPKQISHCTAKQVIFSYKDHRDNRHKQLRLPMPEFIRRYLWHVPEPGVHVVRHYGVYASQCKAVLKKCEQIVGALSSDTESARKKENNGLEWHCKDCGVLMRCVYSVYRTRWIENSYIRASRLRSVQQNVRADAISSIFSSG